MTEEYKGEAHFWTDDADGDPVLPAHKTFAEAQGGTAEATRKTAEGALNIGGKSVVKWADEAMFTAEPSDASKGPRVFLLQGPADPLGAVAACAKMYSGEVVRDLAHVSDVDRNHFLEEMKKTKLKMPLEAVTFHFLIDNVTRGFTHQLVRQRTAAYAQESTRFAVIEDEFDKRVALPPSLAGTTGEAFKIREEIVNRDGFLEKYAVHDDASRHVTPGWQEWESRFDRLSKAEQIRFRWDLSVQMMQRRYQGMIEDGMPAEDARGLLPTNITTRVHYITNLRGLLDHAGNRLCTQAQFEWRLVFAELAKALRSYAVDNPVYYRHEEQMPAGIIGTSVTENGSAWQYRAIADLLKPVCYQLGSCQFKADFDRKCSIRERVDQNAAIGRNSNEWDQATSGGKGEGLIKAISSVEWLADPEAAR